MTSHLLALLIWAQLKDTLSSCTKSLRYYLCLLYKCAMLLVYFIWLWEQKDREKSTIFSIAFKFTYAASPTSYLVFFSSICNTAVIYAFNRF